MKVDIVGYTQSTYRMPYGIKRIFQHLWFNLVDEAVAGKVFFDKPEGDGSLYCFNDSMEGGSCATAFNVALRIKDQIVREFDRNFLEQSRSALERLPSIREPMSKFTEEYRLKTGEDFWNRKTKIRFALVYGFVDEGLWGRADQTHYDVQGDLLILASRLEKLAAYGEILITEEFWTQLDQESPGLTSGFQLEWREAELKGVGVHRYGILKKQEIPDRSAA